MGALSLENSDNRKLAVDSLCQWTPVSVKTVNMQHLSLSMVDRPRNKRYSLSNSGYGCIIFWQMISWQVKKKRRVVVYNYRSCAVSLNTCYCQGLSVKLLSDSQSWSALPVIDDLRNKHESLSNLVYDWLSITLSLYLSQITHLNWFIWT